VLLKTLEDLPPTTHIMLITTDPQKLLGTITSRCIPIELQPVAKGEVVEHLKKICDLEEVDYQIRALEVIVSQKYGHVRDALTLAEVISLAGAISVDNVRKHLHLALDDYAADIVINAEDWDNTLDAVDKLTQDYSPEDLWEAAMRVIKQGELYRLAPNREPDSEKVKKLIDLFGARLATASEWVLSTGKTITVRTAADFVIGLSFLRDQLGVVQTEEKTRAMHGHSKAHRQQIAVPDQKLTADKFAESIGFVKEDS